MIKVSENPKTTRTLYTRLESSMIHRMSNTEQNCEVSLGSLITSTRICHSSSSVTVFNVAELVDNIL